MTSFEGAKGAKPADPQQAAANSDPKSDPQARDSVSPPDSTPGARRAARLAAARNAEAAEERTQMRPDSHRESSANPGQRGAGGRNPQPMGGQGPARATAAGQKAGGAGAGRNPKGQGGQKPGGQGAKGRSPQMASAANPKKQGDGGGRAVATQNAGMPVPAQSGAVPARVAGRGVPGPAKTPPTAEPATYSHAPVPPARVRRRHKFMIISFLCLVLLPVAAMFYYLFEHAQDRYASNAAFFVHREDTTTSVESMFGLGGFGGSSGTPDADVLYQFIQSQQMVELADQRLDLKQMYSPLHEIDPVFALKPDATLEDMVKYWPRVVSLLFAPDNGLISLEVIAFDPDDAHALGEVILDESAKLIDRLSQIAREDAISQSQADLTLAENRLKTARVAVAEFRSDTDFVDPTAGVAGAEGLITALQQQLANELINRDTLMGTTTRSDDPRIERADRKIASIRDRIEEERGKVGTDQAVAVGAYEILLVDRTFAEQSYTAALAAHDAAVAEARRKSRYLAVHIEPTRADTAVYPQRMAVGTVGAAFIFMIWAIFMLIVYSFHDRR